jgi:metal-responsive CopG/Arc/MetJ family transcriptional regulator
MGRPPKEEGAAIVVPARLPPALASAVDAHAEKFGFTRSEAVRQLIEQGLKAKRIAK